MLGSPVYIEAPAVSPAPGGLYAVADVRVGDVHVGASGAQYLSENCGVSSSIEDPACVTADDRASKTFGEISVVSGEPFAVYKGVQCADISDDDSAWAEHGLELTEGIAVEQRVMQDTLSGAVDLTPASGSAVSIARGIALLEGYAAANYGGVPVLHMGRSTATIGIAEDLLDADSNHVLSTPQGALVANGGGYELNLGPDGEEADEGTAWIYVTGAVVVTRTPVVTNRALGVSDFESRVNIQRALAERMVAVTAECIKAAVLVEVDI